MHLRSRQAAHLDVTKVALEDKKLGLIRLRIYSFLISNSAMGRSLPYTLSPRRKLPSLKPDELQVLEEPTEPYEVDAADNLRFVPSSQSYVRADLRSLA